MPRAPPPALILVSAITLLVWFVVWTRDHHRDVSGLSHPYRFQDRLSSHAAPSSPYRDDTGLAGTSDTIPILSPSDQLDPPIMPHLGNETIKAELGRAAWKLFHTVLARFPETPTISEGDALTSYIYLFARLYPCGECAQHFQEILKKYPPQVSSRNAAAGWGCFVHNLVNESKGKETFDCNKIGEWYDCGCADDEKELKGKGLTGKKEPVEIEREGPTRGG